MSTENNVKNEDEMSLSDMIVILLKRKWWFIGTLIVVLAIGLTYVFLQPVNYTVTYQIKMKENYYNETLSELYPNHEKDLNCLSLQNIPVLFKSEEVLRSAKDLDIDYGRLHKPEVLSIKLVEETSIFNIGVSDPDHSLADNINRTLISAFTDMVETRLKNTLGSILVKIGGDIENLDYENKTIEDTKIAGLKSEKDKLYEELSRYIIDYNIELSHKLEENKNSENVSFYNVIIPPNEIDSKISDLDSEIKVYENEVLENKKSVIDLGNLYEKLLDDEEIITGRIWLVSGSPHYETESNRLRNIAIVIVISIILAAIMAFILNYIESSGLREKIRKK